MPSTAPARCPPCWRGAAGDVAPGVLAGRPQGAPVPAAARRDVVVLALLPGGAGMTWISGPCLSDDWTRPPREVTERWLPVVGYEGLYEVSDLGRVRSLLRKGGNNRWYGGDIKRSSLDQAGYLYVSLSRGGKGSRKRIHQLVAEAFIGPPS